MDKRLSRIIIVALAVFLRFYNLGEQPFFFDESVHTVFVDNVISGTYKYDPAFHGPLLFYLTSVFVVAFGKSEFVYRLVPAIFGVLTVILLFKFERYIGRGADFSALLVAISPIIINYSRFFRNDSQILFFTLAFVYFIFRYLESKKWYHLVLSSISLAFFACSKENFYPIASLLLIYFLFDIRKFKVKDLAISVLAFAFIYISIYTNFFTYTTPITNFSEFPAVKAVEYWRYQHEIARIGGPFWYYLPLLFFYDLPVLVLGVYAIAKWIYKREMNTFKSFTIYWFLVNLIFYSYVQEKVPWLVVHIELPLYIIAGMCLAELKRFRVPIIIATCAFLIYSSVHLNIINPTNPAEPALYLPTSFNVKEFREELKDLNISKVCVFMSPGDYWPLPCYLNDFKTYYFPSLNRFESTIKSYDCEVVILNQTNALKVNYKSYVRKEEICLRSWVSYSYESLNPIRILEFLIFRKPMGSVCYFNHTVYFLR